MTSKEPRCNELPMESPQDETADTTSVLLASRSSSYLLIGTLCGIVGGGFSIYITYAYSGEYTRMLNMEGERFPSGNPYWPPSVSNMVNDIESPQGKVWLCFMVTSAFLTMLSQYPFTFPNVYIGNDVPLLPFVARVFPSCFPNGFISMMSARTYLPQIGMLMVALVRTTPRNVWRPAQNATTVFHTGGALLWIGVALYTEVYTLAVSKVVAVGKAERRLRWACVVLALISASFYIVSGILSPDALGLCCDVEYRPVTMATVEKARANSAFSIAEQNLILMEGAHFTPNATAPLYMGMYNSASGGALVMIMLGFWGEMGAGAFMLLNLIVIWYFSENRRVQLPDSLADELEAVPFKAEPLMLSSAGMVPTGVP